MNLVLEHMEDFLPKQIRLLKSAIKLYKSIIIPLGFVVVAALPFSEEGSGWMHAWCDHA